MNKPEEIIEKLGYYSATVHGVSMNPLLVNHRDCVYIEKISQYKKYDVLLFRRASGQLVLHRLLKINGDSLVMSGDNDPFMETISKNQVIGVMKEFTRKGKVYNIKNRLYVLYYRIWCASFSTKKLLSWIYNKIKNAKYKFIGLKNKFLSEVKNE